jgi:hypothetical protein
MYQSSLHERMKYGALLTYLGIGKMTRELTESKHCDVLSRCLAKCIWSKIFGDIMLTCSLGTSCITP